MTDLRDHLRNALHDAVCPLPCDSTTMGYLIRQADALLPIIAAHEAEVVGRILDRIDALHQVHDCDRDGEGWRADCLIIFGGGCARHGCCRECGVPDCPTRRLTAEIRGELSHG